jgi:hypothetical protein
MLLFFSAFLPLYLFNALYARCKKTYEKNMFTKKMFRKKTEKKTYEKRCLEKKLRKKYTKKRCLEKN